MPDTDTTVGVEASELGLAPGMWPGAVTYKGARYTRISIVRDREGDIMYAVYRDGIRRLEVFND